MTIVTKIFVGIDVSKKNLDVHLHPLNQGFKIENSPEGIKKLLQELSTHDIGLIVCESSGGYEHLLMTTLRKVNYRFWQVDPKQIKAFIKSQGVKAKTDKIDAKMIALFASQNMPKYEQKNKSEQSQKLMAFSRRRAALTDMIASEKKRLGHPSHSYCKQEIQEHIEYMQMQLAKIDLKIKDLVNSDPEWKKKSDLMQSVPGIGAVTAANLIAEMPELGTLSGKQAGALLGVVPYTQESGSYQWGAHIEGGRFLPRNMCYMSALTASRCNEKYAEFYQRLIKRGKEPKLALVGVMRKMIIAVNAMLRKGEAWPSPV